MIWGSAALACVNPKGFRKHMDYWKWYINMGRTPDGHDLARYYIGSKRNNGGDGYLGWDKYNHAAIAMMFAVGRKKLFIHGNNVRNWYNSKGGESMVAFYSKTYKDKGELLDFLTKKTDEISQYHEVADTLKFLKNVLRGIHKEKATEVYEAILQKIGLFVHCCKSSIIPLQLLDWANRISLR